LFLGQSETDVASERSRTSGPPEKVSRPPPHSRTVCPSSGRAQHGQREEPQYDSGAYRKQVGIQVKISGDRSSRARSSSRIKATLGRPAFGVAHRGNVRTLTPSRLRKQPQSANGIEEALYSLFLTNGRGQPPPVLPPAPVNLIRSCFKLLAMKAERGRYPLG